MMSSPRRSPIERAPSPPALRTLALGLLVACAACSLKDRPGPDAVEAASPLPVLPSHAAAARSSEGMVVTGSPHATEAGARILAAGGNAVDAAVAAAFALAVAEPTQSGLGGRTQLLLRMADGTVHAIDGTTQVPAEYDPATAPTGEHGHGAVGIPGSVAALTRALEEHGTLSLARVLEPARQWARYGHTLTAGEAGRLAELLPELDPASEAAQRFRGPGGTQLEPGSLLVQEDLAGVLDLLAEDGSGAFYHGSIGHRIAEDMAAHGGFVTRSDLATYRAEDSAVGFGRFRGLQLVGAYLPASGVTVIEALQILDRFGLPGNEAVWAAFVAEALEASFEDREIAESWPAEGAVAWLTSDTLADRRAREIEVRLSGLGAERTAVRATRSPVAFEGDPSRVRTAPGRIPVAAPAEEHPYTTHISAADTFGNVVAMTQSLGPTGGSRVVTPGLGFLYASTLGGYLAGGGPGYRPWSSQAPLLVLREGVPWLVMGGAGSRRILSAIVATLSRLADQELDLESAMAAPRLHPSEGTIHVEHGWPAADALRALGYQVESRPSDYFARVNVVQRSGGAFLGVGEPRWLESAAAGPRNAGR
jgi:gamma-glutamyltranspeptidase/glutathione hydrolase